MITNKYAILTAAEITNNQDIFGKVLQQSVNDIRYNVAGDKGIIKFPKDIQVKEDIPQGYPSLLSSLFDAGRVIDYQAMVAEINKSSWQEYLP